MQEALREKEKAVLAFQAAENNEIKLRNSVFALEIKFEQTCDKFKRDVEYKDQINNLEVQEFKKHIHGMLYTTLVIFTMFDDFIICR